LTIQKQNIGGSATEVFTGHYSGPVSGTFSVSQAQPFSVSVPIGTYTITEDSGAGFTYVGGFAYSPFNGNCSTLSGQGSEQPGPVTVDIAVGQPGGDPTKAVCLVNEPVSEVHVVKHDDVDTAHGGNTGQWTFAIDAAAGGPVHVTAGIPRSEGSVQTIVHQFGDVVAVGTVTEQTGSQTSCAEQLVKTFQTSVGSPGNFGNVANFSSTPGTPTTIGFYNTDCGKVLGAGALDVFKVNDLDGNKTQDAGDAGLAWDVTVSCPGLANLHGTTPAHFAGLPNNTTCSVTETPAAGYRVIGWRSSDIGTATGQVDADGAGVTTTVHVDDGDRLSVTFYNQPRVNVRVRKREIVGTGDGTGEGWAITVTGCGVNLTLTTLANGTATFSDLPPCTFTVSEEVDSKGGFVPIGATSVQVTATLPGETADVGFVNASTETFCATCGSPTVFATPTPTPVPALPTAATTAPAATRTPPAPQPTPAGPTVSVTPAGAGAVAGVGTSVATPLPPRTGNGRSGGQAGGPAISLALLGVLALAGGGIVLKLGKSGRTR
jgi:hypothetical protein